MLNRSLIGMWISSSQLSWSASETRPGGYYKPLGVPVAAEKRKKKKSALQTLRASFQEEKKCANNCWYCSEKRLCTIKLLRTTWRIGGGGGGELIVPPPFLLLFLLITYMYRLHTIFGVCLWGGGGLGAFALAPFHKSGMWHKFKFDKCTLYVSKTR